MKAILRPVKVWAPHTEKDIKDEHKYGIPGSLTIYVGSLDVGWIEPLTTEPEELFRLHPSKILYDIDINDVLTPVTIYKKQGRSMQWILDNIELAFKEFLKRICL